MVEHLAPVEEHGMPDALAGSKLMLPAGPKPDARLARVDKYGIPYPIHPYEPPVNAPSGRLEDGSTWFDEDHAYYCRNEPELQGDDGGLALRVSLAQTAYRWLHANKHYAHEGGLESYPETPAQKFAALVITSSGYRPREAWDYRDRENPTLVTMSKRMHQDVSSPAVTHFVRHTDRDPEATHKTEVMSRATIGKFFASYARSQNLADIVDESKIDCFLNTLSEDKRKRLGKHIIYEAINHASEPVNPIYLEAFHDIAVQPRLATARDVVIRVFDRRFWPNYIDVFSETIKQQLGITESTETKHLAIS